MKKKTIVFYILSFLNRIAHWVDLLVYYYLCDWLYKAQFSDSKLGILIYLPLLLQIWYCVKYEYLSFKSKAICKDILNNGRVMAFSGKQGCGKSSFATYLASYRQINKVYSNTPLKLRGKYSYMLTEDILALDSRIADNSLIFIDEATLFFNNLKVQENLSSKKKIKDEVYAQEILTQCVRHFTDGNIFYISTDCTRLPAPIRENVGLTNFMLMQDSKTISYVFGTLVVMVGRLLGYDFRNGLRQWDFQQFEKIPETNYTFDLSNQDKDTNLSKYANLISIYTFNDPNLFDYNDRFLQGVYLELPEHIDEQWLSLDYNRELLRKIGYGAIVDFFDQKKHIRTLKSVVKESGANDLDSDF